MGIIGIYEKNVLIVGLIFLFAFLIFSTNVVAVELRYTDEMIVDSSSYSDESLERSVLEILYVISVIGRVITYLVIIFSIVMVIISFCINCIQKKKESNSNEGVSRVLKYSVVTIIIMYIASLFIEILYDLVYQEFYFFG